MSNTTTINKKAQASLWLPEIKNEHAVSKSPTVNPPTIAPGKLPNPPTTAAAKALAGQLSPQAALDEAAKQWEDILNRVGKDNVRAAYSVGVAMEDNKL